MASCYGGGYGAFCRHLYRSFVAFEEDVRIYGAGGLLHGQLFWRTHWIYYGRKNLVVTKGGMVIGSGEVVVTPESKQRTLWIAIDSTGCIDHLPKRSLIEKQNGKCPKQSVRISCDAFEVSHGESSIRAAQAYLWQCNSFWFFFLFLSFEMEGQMGSGGTICSVLRNTVHCVQLFTAEELLRLSIRS